MCAAIMDARGIRHEKTAIESGMCICVAAFQPGGTPRTIEGRAIAEVKVCINPAVSVVTTVAKAPNPDTAGNAVALGWWVPRRALYVLVASLEETISPIGAVTDVLNAYAGVVYVGVGRRTFGSVVAIVTDSDAKKDDTASGDSTVTLAA